MQHTFQLEVITSHSSHEKSCIFWQTLDIKRACYQSQWNIYGAILFLSSQSALFIELQIQQPFLENKASQESLYMKDGGTVAL